MLLHYYPMFDTTQAAANVQSHAQRVNAIEAGEAERAETIMTELHAIQRSLAPKPGAGLSLGANWCARQATVSLCVASFQKRRNLQKLK
jgi:hypothetical protein